MKQSQLLPSTHPYHKMSLLGTLNSLQRLGARAIELVACEPHFYFPDVTCNEANELKQALAARGLNIAVLSVPCSEYPVNVASHNIATRHRSVQYIVQAIQYASEFGAPYVQFVAGEALLGESRDDAWQRMCESLQYLTDVADGYGVTLLCPHHDTDSINLLQSPADIVRQRADVASPALGTMLDTVYLHRGGVGIDDALAALGADNVALVHFADCTGSALHLAPGEGELDLDAALAALDRAGYTGYLAPNPRALRDPYSYEEQPERCMGAAVRWLRERLGD